jgi:LacI family transcriptional regulator
MLLVWKHSNTEATLHLESNCSQWNAKKTRMSDRLEVALILDPGSPYDRGIIRGVADYVTRRCRDWSVYVEDELASRLPDLKTWAGDGIVANFDDRRIANAVVNLGIPVVGVGGGYGYYNESTGIPYVRTDNEGIARMGAEHLISLGLGQFAFCSHPPTQTNGWAKERAEEFRRYVNEAGFPCRVYTGRYHSVRNWRRSQEELQGWLSKLPRPIGMMACDDSRARHVLQACQAIGLKVPEEVALVGVDNDELMCELTQPPLTSIEQGSIGVGFEAAATLERMMAGESPEQECATVPPVGLIARHSTDILAVADPDVAKALHYIRQHALKSLQVNDVLKVVRMSRSNLEAKFRESLGRTIHSEIRRVRIEAARRLLTTTNIPIKEIAGHVGISSVQYFTAMIRRTTGQTPGQIRKASLH